MPLSYNLYSDRLKKLKDKKKKELETYDSKRKDLNDKISVLKSAKDRKIISINNQIDTTKRLMSFNEFVATYSFN